MDAGTKERTQDGEVPGEGTPAPAVPAPPASPASFDSSERTWSVRELADELGVTTRTLRFYEAEGLLTPRRVGTARIYTARDHTRLVLILRGKRFGMSLPEIREIVDMYDDAGTGERGQLAALIARLDEIGTDLRARLHDLTRTLAEVDEVAARCRARLAELPGAEATGAGSADADVDAERGGS